MLHVQREVSRDTIDVELCRHENSCLSSIASLADLDDLGNLVLVQQLTTRNNAELSRLDGLSSSATHQLQLIRAGIKRIAQRVGRLKSHFFQKLAFYWKLFFRVADKDK